jgi:inorganic pyrophosphatase/exopolyphosphatase
MSAESAILVYSAIISNTLNFKGGVTTERDRAAASWLEQFITVPANYWRELFLAKSDLSRSKLAERIEGDFAWLIIGDKRVGIAQLEIIGAAELIANREAEMIMALTKLKTDLQLDYIFQNTIELEQQQNYIVASDQSTRQLLEKVLDVSFQGNLAIRDQLIMRKQIIPLIKAELTK